MMFQKIIRGFAENPKSLFLFDGLGALVSAFLLGVVLVKFESTFGMPKEKLYFLAGAACLFVIYDLVCYFKANQNWRPLVKGIAFINLTYTLVSLGLMIYFQDRLTNLGFLYFIVEILILFVLVYIEFKVAKTSIDKA